MLSQVIQGSLTMPLEQPFICFTMNKKIVNLDMRMHYLFLGIIFHLLLLVPVNAKDPVSLIPNYEEGEKVDLEVLEDFKATGDSLWLNGEFESSLKEFIKVEEYRNYIPKKMLAQVTYKMGLCYQMIDVYEKALDYYFRYLNFFPEVIREKGYAMGVNRVAEVYFILGNYQNAHKYYLKSLSIQESIQDSSGIHKNLYDLGTMFYYQEDYKNALKYYKKCEGFSSGSPSKTFTVNSAMGSTYQKMGQLEKALYYNNKSLKIAKESENPTSIGYAYQNIGLTYMEMGIKEFDNAYFYLERSCDYFKDGKYNRGLAISLNHLGDLQFRNMNYNKSQVAYEKAYEVGSQYNFTKEKAVALEGLAVVHEKMGHWEETVQFLKSSYILRDSIINENTIEEMAIQKSAYDIEKKDRELSLSNSLLEKNREITFVLAFSFIIIVLLSTIFLIVLKKQLNKIKKANKELNIKQEKIANQNIVLERTNHQLELANVAKEKVNQKLERTNFKLEQANEQLSNYAYVASHDLKEPLRTIQSFSQLILRQSGEKFDDKTKGYFDYIISGVDRMKQFVDDLLKYSRIDRMNEDPVKVNLDKVLSEVVDNLKSKIQETQTKIVINHSNMPIIDGFKIHFSQLFQNIISNGIKFKKNDVTPIIAIDCKEKEENYCISIKDNGIGMPEKAKLKIFEMFTRLHKEQRYSGTGIGLATCKRIVDFYKGDIWVESEVDVGSTFFFTIPKDNTAIKAHGNSDEYND